MPAGQHLAPHSRPNIVLLDICYILYTAVDYHVGVPAALAAAHYRRHDKMACALQVPVVHIHQLDLIPDIDQGLLKINIFGSQAAAGAPAQVSVA